MSYLVELSTQARKYLEKVPKKVAGQLIARLEALEVNPRPRGCEKIKPERNRYRIRSGNYRIIYEVRDNVLSVLVIRIDHRQSSYKNP